MSCLFPFHEVANVSVCLPFLSIGLPYFRDVNQLSNAEQVSSGCLWLGDWQCI